MATTKRNQKILYLEDSYDKAEQITNLKGSYYGFEMECDIDDPNSYAPGYDEYCEDEDNFYCTDNYDCIEEVVDPTPNKRKYGLFATEDGSLTNTGVEFVTKNPVPINLITKGNWMESTLEGLVTKSKVIKGTQPNKYGLHININVNGWAIEHLIAYLTAINLCMMSTRTRELRGRPINIQPTNRLWRHRDSVLVETPPAWQQYFNFLRKQENDNIGTYDTLSIYPMAYTERHACVLELGDSIPQARAHPAGIREESPVIEVRGFQMDTNPEIMKKRVDFLEALKTASRVHCRKLVDIATGVVYGMSVEDMDMFVKMLLQTPKQAIRTLSKPDISPKARKALERNMQLDTSMMNDLEEFFHIAPTYQLNQE